jgi:cell division protein FtsZ
MKEFEEVGSTVADLASEDATVVMGTVIDPELGDDLRVTVVATGLGGAMRGSRNREKPMRLVANGTTGRQEMMMTEESHGMENNTDFRREVSDSGRRDLFTRQKDIDYLDIPSFLRTQAD